VTGKATDESEKLLFENDSPWMLTDREPVEVTVSGWDETLPLDPLKPIEVEERLMLLLLLWERAQTGLAISIAARGRRIVFFTKTITPTGKLDPDGAL
jgi:hypothetical protein